MKNKLKGVLGTKQIATLVIGITFGVLVLSYGSQITDQLIRALYSIFNIFRGSSEDIVASNSMKALKYAINCESIIVANASLAYRKNCWESASKNDIWLAGSSVDPGGGKIFGKNTVVNCYPQGNGGKETGYCRVKNFKLPQEVDNSTKWLKAFKDPKFLTYYQSFPQGEAKRWTGTGGELTSGYIIASGVIGGLMDVTFHVIPLPFEKKISDAVQGIGRTVKESFEGTWDRILIKYGIRSSDDVLHANLKAMSDSAQVKNLLDRVFKPSTDKPLGEYVESRQAKEGMAKMMRDSYEDADTLYKHNIEGEKLVDHVQNSLDSKLRPGGGYGELFEQLNKEMTEEQINEFTERISREAVALHSIDTDLVAKNWPEFDRVSALGQSISESLEKAAQEGSERAARESMEELIQTNVKNIQSIPNGPTKSLILKRSWLVGRKVARSKSFQLGVLNTIKDSEMSEVIPGGESTLNGIKCMTARGPVPSSKSRIIKRLIGGGTLTGFKLQKATTKAQVCGVMTAIGYSAMKADSANQKYKSVGINSLALKKPMVPQGDISKDAVREKIFGSTREFELNNYAHHFYIELDKQQQSDLRFYQASPCTTDLTISYDRKGYVLPGKSLKRAENWEKYCYGTVNVLEDYKLGNYSDVRIFEDKGGKPIKFLQTPMFNFGQPETNPPKELDSGENKWKTKALVRNPVSSQGTPIKSYYEETLRPSCIAEMKEYSGIPADTDLSAYDLLNKDSRELAKSFDSIDESEITYGDYNTSCERKAFFVNCLYEKGNRHKKLQDEAKGTKIAVKHGLGDWWKGAFVANLPNEYHLDTIVVSPNETKIKEEDTYCYGSQGFWSKIGQNYGWVAFTGLEVTAELGLTAAGVPPIVSGSLSGAVFGAAEEASYQRLNPPPWPKHQ